MEHQEVPEGKRELVIVHDKPSLPCLSTLPSQAKGLQYMETSTDACP